MLAQGLCENRAAGKFNISMHSRASCIRLVDPDDREQYITACRRTAAPNSVHCRPLSDLIGPLLSNCKLCCRPIQKRRLTVDDLLSHAHGCLRRALSLSLAGAKEEGCRNFLCCNCDGASHETLPSIDVLSCVSGRLPDHPGVRVWCFEDALSRFRCGQPPGAIPVPEGGKGVSYRINV